MSPRKKLVSAPRSSDENHRQKRRLPHSSLASRTRPGLLRAVVSATKALRGTAAPALRPARSTVSASGSTNQDREQLSPSSELLS